MGERTWGDEKRRQRRESRESKLGRGEDEFRHGVYGLWRTVK